jgi:hypothetical protein
MQPQASWVVDQPRPVQDVGLDMLDTRRSFGRTPRPALLTESITKWRLVKRRDALRSSTFRWRSPRGFQRGGWGSREQATLGADRPRALIVLPKRDRRRSGCHAQLVRTGLSRGRAAAGPRCPGRSVAGAGLPRAALVADAVDHAVGVVAHQQGALVVHGQARDPAEVALPVLGQESARKSRASTGCPSSNRTRRTL